MRMIRSLGIAVVLALAVAGCDSSSSPPGGGPDATTSIDAKPGGSCGGLAGGMCVATEFCDYDGHSCGTSDAIGTCTARPEICAADVRPVCGCNGVVYASGECEAHKAGFDTSATANCAAPSEFPTRCGDTFCRLRETCNRNGTEPSATYTCT